MATLTAILEICDAKCLLLLPLWVPREANQFADYLSHLAVYRSEDQVEGAVSSLGVEGQNRGSLAEEEVSSTRFGNSFQV